MSNQNNNSGFLGEYVSDSPANNNFTKVNLNSILAENIEQKPSIIYNSEELDDTKVVSIPNNSTINQPANDALLNVQKPIPDNSTFESTFVWPRILRLENIFFGLMILMLVFLRISFFSFESGDYEGFLIKWSRVMTENGSFEVFKNRFYDYTPPYLYFMYFGIVVLKVQTLVWVKLGSIVFDFVMAYYVAQIISLKKPQFWKYGFLVTLMLPTVIFNGSWWGQCDVIYSSFVIGCLYYLLTKKTLQACLFFGIGFLLKIQTIFFLPVIVLLILTRNINWKTLIILPITTVAVYFVGITPALLAGRELLGKNGLLSIYLEQSGVYKGLVMGAAPTIYQWIDPKKYDIFYPIGLIVPVIAITFLFFYISKSKITKLSNEMIIKYSMLIVTLVPFLLPKMHERYFFLAEVMAIIYTFWFPKKLFVGVFVTLSSFAIYISGVIGGEIPNLIERRFLTLWFVFLLVYLIFDIVKSNQKSTNNNSQNELEFGEY